MHGFYRYRPLLHLLTSDDKVIPLPYYSTVFHGDLSQRIVDCCRFNQTYITVDLSATFDLILFLFVDLVSLFIVW